MKKILPLFLLLCFNYVLLAKTLPKVDSPLPGSSFIVNGNSNIITHSLLLSTEVWSIFQNSSNKFYSISNTVELQEVESTLLPVSFDYELTVTGTLRYWVIGSTSPAAPVAVSLTIRHDPAEKISRSIDYFTYSNAYKTEFDIQTVTLATNGTLSQADLYTEVSKVVQLNLRAEQNVFQVPVFTISPYLYPNCVDNTTNELIIKWQPVNFAEEYELEITHRDDYADIGVLNPSNIPFDFKENSTRIVTRETFYRVPLVYERGYLLYRVRAVGVGGQEWNKRIPCDWSGASNGIVSAFPHKYPIIISHMADKMNWQLSTTYSDEGKRKDVVQYYDGLNMNRQTVTGVSQKRTVFSQNLLEPAPTPCSILGYDKVKEIIAQEVIYDFNGRPALQIMPVPTGQRAITYIHKLNQNQAGQAYSWVDFDKYNACSLPASKLSDNASGALGAGAYYSPNNPNKIGYNAFVPDGKGFPFSRIHYTPDNTGRTYRQGGVGDIHQLDQGHETKFYYAKPNQIELDRMFGTEVGNAERYQKNMVVDPNGQVSVSYLNPEGKTIATSLAGVRPDNLLPLDNENYPQETIPVDLVASNTPDTVEHSLTIIEPFTVPKQTTYNFNYTVKGESLTYSSCVNNSICLDCVYDLDISLVNNDECVKVPVFSYSGTFGDLVKNTEQVNLDLTCLTNSPNSNSIDKPANFPSAFTAKLEAGSYTLIKTLKVNKFAADAYIALVFKDTCQSVLQNFINQETAKIDTLACFQSCSSCLVANPTTPANCDEQCPKPMNACEQAKHSMRLDVSPGGQYGQYDIRIENGVNVYDATNYPLSVFNPGGLLINSTDLNTILLQLPPGQRTITYLILNWNQTTSPDAFLPKHPEYCMLTWCNTENRGRDYDLKLSETTTYSGAVSTSLLSTTSSNTPYKQLLLNDPFFYPSGPTGSATIEGIQFEAFLNNPCGNGVSVLRAAMDVAYCQSQPGFQQIINNTGSGSIGSNVTNPPAPTCTIPVGYYPGHTFGSNPATKDLEWQMLRTMYLSYKETYLYKSRKAYSITNSCFNGCIGADFYYHTYVNSTPNPFSNPFNMGKDGIGHSLEGNTPVNHQDLCGTVEFLFENKTKRFTNRYDAFNKSGIDINTIDLYGCLTNAQISNIQSQIGSAASEYICDTCATCSTTSQTNTSQTANTQANSKVFPSSDIEYTQLLPRPRWCWDWKIEVILNTALPLVTTTNSVTISGAQITPEIRGMMQDSAKFKVEQIKVGYNAKSKQYDVELQSTKEEKRVLSFPATLLKNEPKPLKGICCITTQEPQSISLTMQFVDGTSAFSTASSTFSTIKCPPPTPTLPKDTCVKLSTFATDLLDYLNGTILPPPPPTRSDSMKRVDDYSGDFSLDTSIIIVRTGRDSTNAKTNPNSTSNNTSPNSLEERVIRNDSLRILNPRVPLNPRFPRFDVPCTLTFEISNGRIVSSGNAGNGNPNVPDTKSPVTQENIGSIVLTNPTILTDNPTNPGNGNDASTLALSNSGTIATLRNTNPVRTDSNLRNASSIGDTRYTRGDATSYTHLSELGSVAIRKKFCTITLDNCDWKKSSIHFVSIKPFFPNAQGNALTNEFIITYVKIVGTRIDTVRVHGVSDCFPINECHKPYFCDKDSLLQPAPANDFNGCVQAQVLTATFVAYSHYGHWLDSMKNDLRTKYFAKCMGAKDDMDYKYTDESYHFTLYYYDQAGNLVRTVPPAGVRLLSASMSGNIKTSRDSRNASGIPNGTPILPTHTYITNYAYNSLNQLRWQITPDAGRSIFFYDKLGRIAASQNAVQQTTNAYSYTWYDKLGRIVESGKLRLNGSLSQSIVSNYNGWKNYLYSQPRAEITFTQYDAVFSATVAGKFGQVGQNNLRGRVASVFSFEDEAKQYSADYRHATHYTYDVTGNVPVLLQDYPNTPLGTKAIAYNFDLVSGKVNEVRYSPDQPDEFRHSYKYDDDFRLTKVMTSKKGIVWETDAEYFYYKHGPLARTELGQLKVQGLDYIYTLQGWIKGVNGTTQERNQDAGRDGIALEQPGNPQTVTINGQQVTVVSESNSLLNTTGPGYHSLHNPVAADAFGYVLNYYTGDYNPIESNLNPMTGMNTAIGDVKPLYNGNISRMFTWLQGLDGLGMNYRYDQLNRLKQQQAFMIAPATGVQSLLTDDAYGMHLSYDGSGNIINLRRMGRESNIKMDNLDYHYMDASGNVIPNMANPPLNATNRLAYVTDELGYTPSYPESSPVNGTVTDIDNQNPGNYDYDAIGNLIQDKSENISKIEWNLQGKISAIRKSTSEDLYFEYDALGNRVRKYVTATKTNTFYVRDAQGNIMATYNEYGAILTLQEMSIYGISRLGVSNANMLIPAPGQGIATTVDWQNIRPIAITEDSIVRGSKQYELSNHLGNVLVTISDRRLQVAVPIVGASGVVADVLTASDYYAFGMGMPGRQLNVGSYRYGMNTQEKDIEVGEGIYTAELWEYNSRLGVRWNLDPEPTIGVSDYACFLDNPTQFSDTYGNKPSESDGDKDKDNCISCPDKGAPTTDKSSNSRQDNLLSPNVVELKPTNTSQAPKYYFQQGPTSETQIANQKEYTAWQTYGGNGSGSLFDKGMFYADKYLTMMSDAPATIQLPLMFAAPIVRGITGASTIGSFIAGEKLLATFSGDAKLGFTFGKTVNRYIPSSYRVSAYKAFKANKEGFVFATKLSTTNATTVYSDLALSYTVQGRVNTVVNYTRYESKMFGFYLKGTIGAQNGIGGGATQLIGLGRGTFFTNSRNTGLAQMRLGIGY